jgi:hypothetical protein
MENVMIIESAIDYDRMSKQIDEMTTTHLQLSITHEQTKSKNLILKSFVVKFLDSFEGRFDSDEDAYAPEHMIEYIEAAKWMAANYGRVNNRIDDVTERLNALPFGS